MPRDLQKLLQDIAERSSRIHRYVEEKSFEAFLDTLQLQDSVERNLQVIGEALSQAVQQDRSLIWKISETDKIIAFRHLLTHHYYKVSPLIVWGVLKSSLPQLDREIVELQARLPSTGF